MDTHPLDPWPLRTQPLCGEQIHCLVKDFTFISLSSDDVTWRYILLKLKNDTNKQKPCLDILLCKSDLSLYRKNSSQSAWLELCLTEPSLSYGQQTSLSA